MSAASWLSWTCAMTSSRLVHDTPQPVNGQTKLSLATSDDVLRDALAASAADTFGTASAGGSSACDAEVVRTLNPGASIPVVVRTLNPAASISISGSTRPTASYITHDTSDSTLCLKKKFPPLNSLLLSRGSVATCLR